MSNDEREQLETLRDCSGEIDAKHFSPQETKIMKQLAKSGLVVLRWVITRTGMEKVNATEVPASNS